MLDSSAMLFIVQFEDKPGVAETRQKLLADHFAFLDSRKDKVLVAGSVREIPSDLPLGGLWIIEAENEAEQPARRQDQADDADRQNGAAAVGQHVPAGAEFVVIFAAVVPVAAVRFVSARLPGGRAVMVSRAELSMMLRPLPLFESSVDNQTGILGLHERPIISRLNSMTEPSELQAGMVFALETYCPASDGFSAARIEEEVVVTPDGPRILTLFPAQDLVVTNPY